MPPPLKIPNIKNLVRRYNAGESLNQLAIETGIHRGGFKNGAAFGLVKHLLENGAVLRSASEQERIKWANMKSDPSAINRQLERAWSASRGRVDSPNTKRQRSLTRHARQLHISPDETRLACELIRLGECVSQQHPCGQYNIDVALEKGFIAVEVYSGGIRSKFQLATLRQRTKHLLDCGWNVLFVVGHKTWKIAFPDVANKVIAFRDATGWNKTCFGKYGMVRSDGKPYTGRRKELDSLPRVEGF